MAILQEIVARQGIRAPLDVLMLVAERVDSNVRELEGAFKNLWLQVQLQGTGLNVAVASGILNSLAPRRSVCSPTRLVQIVAEYYNLGADDLTGRSRIAAIAHARHVAMYLLRKENGLSLPVIGDCLGGRDHTTARHGIEKIEREVEHDETLRNDVALLRERIYLPFG
ncbi:MAG: hypothetical protein IPK16_21470 [Anaerolineales bacterium]|nr:hypothetical protein [Anaerolineales bacterium]